MNAVHDELCELYVLTAKKHATYKHPSLSIQLNIETGDLNLLAVKEKKNTR